jgi:hypothetical protein
VPCKKRCKKIRQRRTKRDKEEKIVVGALEKKERGALGPMFDSNFH